MRLAEQRNRRIVVDQKRLRAPYEPRRLRRVEADIDRAEQLGGPASRRAELASSPAPQQLADLAGAGQQPTAKLVGLEYRVAAIVEAAARSSQQSACTGKPFLH